MDERVDYELKGVEVANFDPRNGIIKFKIRFLKNSVLQSFEKEFKFSDTASLVNSVITALKKKDNIVTYDDDILSGYQVVMLKDEEVASEKLFNFFNRMKERYKIMKATKDAKKYMKIFDEVKSAKIIFD